MNGLFKKSIYLFAGLMMLSGIYKASAQESQTEEERLEECQQNFSLYRESFKQWKAANYEGNVHDFIDSWRECFVNCPTISEYLYLDGATIMENIMKVTTDPAQKEKYIDTIEMVFDNRIKYYPNDSRTKQPQEANILWRKAVLLDQVAPERVEDIYNALKRAIELEGKKISHIPIPYYLKSTIDMTLQNKLDPTAIFDTYDQLSEIVDANLKSATESGNKQAEEDWGMTLKRIEQLIEPYASCEDLAIILQKKFDAAPQDIENLRKITSTLDKNKCTDNDLFMIATETLFKLDPSPEAAYMMATTYIKNTEYDNALKSLDEVIRLTDDNDLKYNTEIKMAQILIMQKKYSQARDHARKALQIRPNSGEALILIGKMYAGSSDMCGDDEINKKAVFWPAVDKFNEAKRVDPSVTEEANKQIALYRQYFPAKERLFFYNITAGDSYKVECWINETTTVRSSD